MAAYYRFHRGRFRLQIYVQPKSSKTAWDGVVERNESCWIRLKISAPPVDGAANKEIQKFVAKVFKTAKTKVRIVQGEKSRLKVLELEDVSEKKVQAFIKANKLAEPSNAPE